MSPRRTPRSSSPSFAPAPVPAPAAPDEPLSDRLDRIAEGLWASLRGPERALLARRLKTLPPDGTVR